MRALSLGTLLAQINNGIFALLVSPFLAWFPVYWIRLASSVFGIARTLHGWHTTATFGHTNFTQHLLRPFFGISSLLLFLLSGSLWVSAAVASSRFTRRRDGNVHRRRFGWCGRGSSGCLGGWVPLCPSRTAEAAVRVRRVVGLVLALGVWACGECASLAPDSG